MLTFPAFFVSDRFNRQVPRNLGVGSNVVPVMTTQRRRLYNSSNGDKWFLCRERSGGVVVLHEPNAPSGGKASQIELSDFLAKQNQGPQHQGPAPVDSRVG